jgi:hypothetical protein
MEEPKTVASPSTATADSNYKGLEMLSVRKQKETVKLAIMTTQNRMRKLQKDKEIATRKAREALEKTEAL